MNANWANILKRIDSVRWEVPVDFDKRMNVPARLIASPKMLNAIISDNAIMQLVNVAMLPGILKYSIAMPDIHWGYGFPIGGVAAFSYEKGIISPGGVGYDINCGVRILKTDLTVKDIMPYLEKLTSTIFSNVPCGVGSKGKIRVSTKELEELVVKGSRWAVEKGYGFEEDIERTEEFGQLKGANPEFVSQRAIKRGMPQLGSLGAGNHFLEIQKIEEIYDEKLAKAMGLEKDKITVMIHTGSRGFGHQICDDYIKIILRAMAKYGINVPDRQLASVPIKSDEGQRYFGAMAAAANFAWNNRQLITYWVRESFEKVFGESAHTLGMHLVYDVAHNIAKIEEHVVDGRKIKVVVHRKGATRAFPKFHPALPDVYKSTGQPILLPGDMGTMSFILVGTNKTLTETFGSSAHGAGRILSRKKAKKATSGRNIFQELRKKGILLKAASGETVREEVPDAYKDVEEVANIMERGGLAKKVVKLIPLAVIKG